MIFQIEQNQKTMLTADFSIFREKNIIGSVSVKGEINSMYKSAVINLGKDQYHMSYAGDLFSSVEKSSEKKKKYWQPYTMSLS